MVPKIKLHSHYHHFQKHEPGPADRFINCYNDIFILKRKEIRPDDIALLIEPRFIQPDVYDWVGEHYDTFRYVFTHDSYLLNNIANALPIFWGGVWGYYEGPKTKTCSMVASWKENNYWRRERVKLARILKDNPDVDVYGTFDGGPKVDTRTIYADYKFNIAMENQIDNYWFTEKLCNCFSHKTIPIYIGAPCIKKTSFFNTDGIIFAGSIGEVQKILKTTDFDEMYERCYDAIEDNYLRVRQFAVFEDWFYTRYDVVLEDIIGGY